MMASCFWLLLDQVIRLEQGENLGTVVALGLAFVWIHP